MRPLLPPGWVPCAPDQADRTFSIVAVDLGTYGFARNDDVINHGLELDLALAVLDAQVRLYIGVAAPERVFIHAGVVADGERLVVIPGQSFSGKTTLVAALARAGATYYSDEYAVLDADGLVHPYARRLAIRDLDAGRRRDQSVESFGGTVGTEPRPISAVVITRYREEAVWQPRELSAGEGAMALLANAVPARERPAQVMRTITAALEGAVVLEGERGEAEAAAPQILAELERISAESR